MRAGVDTRGMQPHQGPPQPPVQRTNTIAAVSFLLAVFGLFAGLLAAPLSLLLALAAIVCAIIGLVKSSELGGMWLALLGLLVGGATLIGALTS